MSNISPEIALLGFLYAEPGHGYDLHQQFQAMLGQVWRLSQSQAYAILKRLESRGDIKSEPASQDKLPTRQMLYITAAGKARFETWLLNNAGRNARSIRLEFLTRLYFSQRYFPEKTAKIYTAQCAEINTNIAHVENLLAKTTLKDSYNRLSLDLRLRQLRLIQAWMKEIQAQFDIPENTTE